MRGIAAARFQPRRPWVLFGSTYGVVPSAQANTSGAAGVSVGCQRRLRMGSSALSVQQGGTGMVDGG
jgi:hypothetical protein